MVKGSSLHSSPSQHRYKEPRLPLWLRCDTSRILPDDLDPLPQDSKGRIIRVSGRRSDFS